jgi:hypothetical protein
VDHELEAEVQPKMLSPVESEIDNVWADGTLLRPRIGLVAAAVPGVRRAARKLASVQQRAHPSANPISWDWPQSAQFQSPP